jgi:predicted enzyme related to lactoylglutathione lyase
MSNPGWRGLALAAALNLSAALAWTGRPAMAADPPPGPAPLVFFDLAGPDGGKLRTFYGSVFGWTIGADNRIARADTGALDGTIRQDPAETVLYLGVPDVTAALKAVVAAGGAIEQPRFVVPGVVILGLFRDPAGNRMGLVETKDGRPIIPPAH